MPNGERAWIQKRVDGLTEGADRIEPRYNNKVDNSFNTWSALKLIVHSATVNMYTKVISEHKEDFFYVDTLAGSGLSEYGEGECFLGSPIVAAKDTSEPFTKMYFIEDDEDKKDLLEERLEFIFNDPKLDVQEPGDWKVYHGDANERIHDVVQDIWEVAGPDFDFNTLTFVDNQAMDFHWDAMEAIGDLTGDLLVNYQSAMAIGMNLNNKAAHEGQIKEFFGRDMWEVEPKTREKFKQEYMHQMKSLFEDGCRQVAVKVDSGSKSYEYDMLYATRETTGGSGYVSAIEYVKEFVENVDGGDVEEMLDILHGEQAVVNDFLPTNSDIDEDLLDGENNDVDENQAGLDEFL